MPTMTGRPGYWTMEMNGGSSASYLARTPYVPLFSTLSIRGESRRAFRLPAEGGDHFQCCNDCTVEPLPGHIWCRNFTNLEGAFSQRKRREFLGSNFGRMDFLRMFIFEPPDLFANCIAGVLSPHFCEKMCPEKSSRKIHDKILQNL